MKHYKGKVKTTFPAELQRPQTRTLGKIAQLINILLSELL